MKSGILHTTLLVLALAVSSHALASETSWTFKVFLGKKAIGYHTFRIDSRNGITSAQISARFKVKILFVTVYHYQFTDLEQWQNGCLKQINSSANVNGKHYKVHGKISGNLLKMRSTMDGHSTSTALPGCVMSFAYWKPAMLYESRLLNAQTGKYVRVKTQLVGKGPIKVEGSTLQANHYRLTADKLNIDLWYTLKGRWLKLESKLSDGRTLSYKLVEQR